MGCVFAVAVAVAVAVAAVLGSSASIVDAGGRRVMKRGFAVVPGSAAWAVEGAG